MQFFHILRTIKKFVLFIFDGFMPSDLFRVRKKLASEHLNRSTLLALFS